MTAARPDLIVQRPEGLYCAPGGFFIDPWRPVDRALITHAHADHARPGHGAYLCSAEGEHVLRARLPGITLQTLAWGEAITIGAVRVSMHPAGHVLGSAQVRVEHEGRVWVASGDYFASGAGDHHSTCTAFAPVRCHCFITESTFGLPIYRWRAQAAVMAEVNDWWRANAEAGRASLLMGYSFGKAQRLLAGLDPAIGPIVVHAAVQTMNEAYAASGIVLPPTLRLDRLKDRAGLSRCIVVAPPAVNGSDWLKPLGDYSDAFASGWMQLRGGRRRQGLDRGFVLSDHADWPGLLGAIAATGAERVIVTHGQEAVMVRWLQQQGLEAGSFRTQYGDDALDDAAGEPEAAPAPAAAAAVPPGSPA